MNPKLTAVDEDRYSNIAMNDLVVYAMHKIEGDTTALDFEDIVYACYKIFPMKFGMEKHHDWPDALRVNKRVVDVRSKGFVTGGYKSGFFLSLSGIDRAFVTMKKLELSAGSAVKRKGALSRKGRSRASHLVNWVKSQDSFLRFLAGKEKTDMNEGEFFHLLRVPRGTTPRKIAQNLEHAKSLAAGFDKGKEAHDFLVFCEKNFSGLLKRHSTYRTREGLLKKKKGGNK